MLDKGAPLAALESLENNKYCGLLATESCKEEKRIASHFIFDLVPKAKGLGS